MLIKYLINHKHWSPFEMANMCVEVETSRMISPQILRHKSLVCQEFSQRYSAVSECMRYEARLQDQHNRQNSIEIEDAQLQKWWVKTQNDVWEYAQNRYKEALDHGIAKELARGILPGISKTKLEINGTIRSWIHYFDVRCGKETQKEHREIANAIKNIFIDHFPHISNVFNWTKE